MRPIQDYGLRDWLLADPLRHRLRRLRNLATLAIYNGQKTDRQDELLASLASHVTGEDTAFTVAFNSVRNIEWLADGFARHSRGTTLVVCDNSPTVGARKEISGFCAARGVPYVPLPRPPLQLIIRTNPPLSHGIALTWIFYNLVRPLKPKVFAFIDHDLIPTAPFNFSEKVKDQPVYGRLRAKPTDGERNFWTGRKLTNYWNLWAGYCVFDYAATAHYPLDFTPDNPLRLDTGGQNWTRLYRELDRTSMRFASVDWIEIGGNPGTRFRKVDDWLHVGGISYREDARDRLRIFEDLLARPQVSASSEKPT